MVTPVTLKLPDKLVSPPTLRSSPIPTPPETTSAPDVVLVESDSSVILTLFDALISPLKLTGPSNCERT